MRRRSNKEYLRKGQLIKRIYENDGSYETISRPFRYETQRASTETSGQLMNGFMHTNTTATIKAITDLKYEKGDKVILDDNSTYEIIQIVTESFGEFGRLRGIRRSAKILFVS
jgi:hypothetical protein